MYQQILTVIGAGTNPNNISELINTVLKIIMPILMTVAVASATVFTAITFISGFTDLDGLERKNHIKRLIWIWICCAGVFAASTIVLCLKTYFIRIATGN